MSRMTKIILISVLSAVAVITAAAVGVLGFWMPYNNAQSQFIGDRTVLMQLQEDGSVELTWPLAVNADQYLVEVENPTNGEIEFSQYVDGKTSVTLPELSQSKRTIRIRCASEYKFFLSTKAKLRLGEDPIEFTDIFWQPVITDIV